jgi:cytochrome b561
MGELVAASGTWIDCERWPSMTWLNTRHGYGALTKAFHWLIVVLFALQFVGGHIMTRLETGDTALGLSVDTFYNWHKSIGLLALVTAVLRIAARGSGELPDWAPGLTKRERAIIHRAEQLLYTAMFVMPVSGFVYVMAGDYGVRLFGVLNLPNPIGKHDGLAFAAKWIHIISSYTLLLALVVHLGIVLRHQLWLGDRLLHRMLPRRSP